MGKAVRSPLDNRRVDSVNVIGLLPCSVAEMMVLVPLRVTKMVPVVLELNSTVSLLSGNVKLLGFQFVKPEIASQSFPGPEPVQV